MASSASNTITVQN